MLKSAIIRKQDRDTALILSLLGQGGIPIEVETGIYESPSFSFGNTIQNAKEDYFDFEGFGPYGVCDNIDQVKDRYSKWLNNPELDFCISFTKVSKSDQPSDGGWRWHKWGEYIGTKDPQHEYLYDEGNHIQEVYVYHIYQLLT